MRTFFEEARKTLFKKLENTVSDCVADFLYYDRKEDPELPIGDIEELIKDGVLTVDQIIDMFKKELETLRVYENEQ